MNLPNNYLSYNYKFNSSINTFVLKPKVNFCAGIHPIKNIFEHSQTDEFIKEGLQSISNVRQGFYGTTCDGALPLQNFFEKFQKNAEKLDLKSRGFSTNVHGIADSYLKSSADNPLSTSCVFDCSVMYLYNKEINTHLLYHASPMCEFNNLKSAIQKLMPDGYTHACLLPGDNRYSMIHRRTLQSLFSVIKDNNPSAVVNVYHQSSRYPEIIGYKGELFENPNLHFGAQSHGEYGQATFKIQNNFFCK